uniref:G-protein coupled receptors family 1 profile domain-containing protein n=1 Tax=Maylandia zebra TaxID=106582 RepID=A0A3P9C240_9CICH
MCPLIMDNQSNERSFILSGFNETMNFTVPLFSVTLLYYCVILFFNISLVLLIVLDESLHEPMYILLSSFCINALYGTTGFYPKFLSDLLSSSHRISYEGCLLQAFIAYLAICRPLHYHSFMTKRRLSQLVCFSWLTPSVFLPLMSCLQVLYLNWLIIKLACPDVDTFRKNISANVTLIVYLCHWLFIIWTYIYLIKTCARSREDRLKFTQTCVPHLISLMTFLFFLDPVYMISGSTRLPQSLQNFITIEFLIIPPVMNPLIYGFKLTKIRNRILGTDAAAQCSVMLLF